MNIKCCLFLYKYVCFCILYMLTIPHFNEDLKLTAQVSFIFYVRLFSAISVSAEIILNQLNSCLSDLHFFFFNLQKTIVHAKKK